MAGTLKDFFLGVFAGCVTTAIIFGIVVGFIHTWNRDRELIEYVERQIEIEVLREDYVNRDPIEFFNIPGVRGAADGAVAEFDRKRDEALQRFRSGYFDWGNFRCSVCGN